MPSTAAVMIQKYARVLLARKRKIEAVKRVFDKVHDKATDRYYYYDTRTGVSSWHKPRVLGRDDIPAIPHEAFLTSRGLENKGTRF
jgi:hypothetical protein